MKFVANFTVRLSRDKIVMASHKVRRAVQSSCQMDSPADFGIAISGIVLASSEASNIAGLASRDLERESSRERTNVHSRGARNDRQRVDSLHARWSTTGEPGIRSAAGPDSMCPT